MKLVGSFTCLLSQVTAHNTCSHCILFVCVTVRVSLRTTLHVVCIFCSNTEYFQVQKNLESFLKSDVTFCFQSLHSGKNSVSGEQCWTSYSEMVISYLLLIAPNKSNTFTLFVTLYQK